MSGPEGVQSGVPSQTLIANADTSTTPTDSAQPEQGANPNAVAPDTPSGVSGQQIKSDKAEMYKAAIAAIATGSQKVGLPTPEIKTPLDLQKGAVAVYAKLVSSGKTNDAALFLKTMEKIGEKFGANFGLSKPAAAGQGKPVALNVDKFKGIDAAKNPYAAEYKNMVTEFNSLKAQATPEAGKQQAAPTEATNTAGADPNSGTPQATNAADTQATGNTGKPTEQQLKALKTILEAEVANKDGDGKSISHADIAQSLGKSKLPDAVLKAIDAQLTRPDATKTVDEVIDGLLNPGAGSPNASATAPPNQEPTTQNTSAPVDNTKPTSPDAADNGVGQPEKLW
jgi:hypothetical protein